MLKETGYQEKIVMLAQWFVEIVDVVKKDLRSEHLKVDKPFCRRFFLGKNPSQIQAEELAPAYEKEILEGNVGLGEFIATRWLLKNTDMYGFFESKIKGISADFEALEELPLPFSKELLEDALKQFGAKRTYIFSVFNSVVFPKEIYERLHILAVRESKEFEEKSAHEEGEKTLEALQKRHARELSQIKDKFEKKMSGLERKYLHDTESLKKQLAALQRKALEKVS